MPQVNDFSWVMIFTQVIFIFSVLFCFCHYSFFMIYIKKNIFYNLIYIIL